MAFATTFQSIAGRHIQAVQRGLQQMDATQIGQIAAAFEAASSAGGCVYLCGNGGSAASATHAACDLLRFSDCLMPRLRINALTENVSLITAISNDISYANIFTHQVQGLLRSVDVMVGLSVSGRSENVMRVLEMARDSGATTIGLTGSGSTRMRKACNLYVEIPNSTVQAVEDIHMIILHAVSQELLGEGRVPTGA